MTKHKIIPPRPEPPSRSTSLTALFGMRDLDMLKLLPEKTYGALMGRRSVGSSSLYTVNCPVTHKFIMQDRPEDFPKSPIIRETLLPLTPDNVFSTSGEQWRKQRDIINPAFEQMAVRRSYPAMRDAIGDFVDRVGANGDGREFEMSEPLARVTADVIFRVLVSEPLDSVDASDAYHAFQKFQETGTNVDLSSLLGSRLWRVKGKRLSKQREESAQVLRSLLERIIDRRLAAEEPKPDMMQSVLDGYRAAYGEQMPRNEVVDQLAFLFLAGHETLASAMTWAVYMLALDPDTATEMRQEVDGLVAPGQAIAFEQVGRLALCRAVLREALRLYPPVGFMLREAAADHELRGHHVQPGDTMVIAPWLIQRHRRYWSDPDAFCPHRWTDAQQDAEAKRTMYLPFGSGPRICPGAGFALVEGTLLMAEMVRNFTFRPAAKTPMPTARLTIRPVDGLYVHVDRRPVD